MKKLQPVLNLVNSLIINQIRIDAASVTDEALGVTSQIGSILLNSGETESLSLEDIQVGIERLQLPTPEDLNLYLTLLLERLDMKIALDFWPKAAKLAKNPMVATFGTMIDRVEVRNLRVAVALSPAKVVDVRVTLESCRVTLKDRLMKELTNLDLEVLDFDLKEKDKKKALAAASIRLQDLQVRVLEILLNRLLEAGRDRIPSKAKITSIEITLNEDTLRLAIKSGWWFTTIPLGLRFSTRNNLLGIFIDVMGPVRKLVLGQVHKKAAGKRELSVDGDKIWIDPWVKAPVKIQCKMERFCIDSGALILKFGTLAKALPPPVPEAKAVEEKPSEVNCEGKVYEAKSPETKASETRVPEAEVAEVKAPESKSPGTGAIEGAGASVTHEPARSDPGRPADESASESDRDPSAEAGEPSPTSPELPEDNPSPPKE